MDKSRVAPREVRRRAGSYRVAQILVRCRGVFQREILKSRHYILKFLARPGLVYREGKNWTGRHMM